MRIWAYPRRPDGKMRVWIQDPSGIWAKAGLHTGMDLVAFNGVAVDSFPDFRRALRTVKLGDVVPVDIVRNGSPTRVGVTVVGYDRTRVRFVEAPDPTPLQLERRKLWLSASPN
jgi:predicted metalloprotease with PDZ domain